MTKLRDRVALLNHLEWIFANYRAGRRRRTAVTLGARWPLLCHPFVLYIGKTWPSHGPNMAHFGCRGGRWGWRAVTLGARWPLLCHPFLLYIGKTWPFHGPNMVHFKIDVISVKNFKKFKNAF